MKISRFQEFSNRLTIEEIGEIGFGHVGGSLSICDVLAVLYGGEMKIDPRNPNWEDHDLNPTNIKFNGYVK